MKFVDILKFVDCPPFFFFDLKKIVIVVRYTEITKQQFNYVFIFFIEYFRKLEAELKSLKKEHRYVNPVMIHDFTEEPKLP